VTLTMESTVESLYELTVTRWDNWMLDM